MAYVVVTTTGLVYGVWSGTNAMQMAEGWARGHVAGEWQGLTVYPRTAT